ncbi:MAG: site-2 protease family protein, partial [Microgenomates group bacterium]
ATVLAVAVRITSTPFSPISFFSNLLYPFIILNVILAIFNLIPIHPLDGGKILVGLLPVKDAREMDRFLNRYGTIILFLLIFPFLGGTSPVFLFLSPILNFILGILIPGNPII